MEGEGAEIDPPQQIEDAAGGAEIGGPEEQELNTLHKTQGTQPPVTPTYLPMECVNVTGPTGNKVFAV